MSIARKILFASILAGAALVALRSQAEAQWEVEADPLAYALSGYSLHLAKITGPIRVNLGIFGVDVPEFFHGNEGWSNVMRGAGFKVDYLGSRPEGFFAGVEGGLQRMTYARDGVAGEEERDVVGVGVRAGYRINLGGRGLYVAPWVGVGYNFNGDEVRVGGEEFERSPVTIFPTIHIGWRF